MKKTITLLAIIFCLQIHSQTTINEAPTVSPSSVCVSGTATVTTSSSQSGIEYALVLSTNTTTPIGNLTPGNNGSSLSFPIPTVTVTTVYEVLAFNPNNNSYTTMVPSVTVTVNSPLTLITAQVSHSAVCPGVADTLKANGADTYTWSPVSSTTSSVVVTPTTTTVYTVTGGNYGACTATKTTTVSVTVNYLPVINITSNNSKLCRGSVASLQATGATTYTWSNNLTSSSISVDPSFTATYSVTGVNGNGCKDSTTFTQTVVDCDTTGVVCLNLMDSIPVKQISVIHSTDMNGDGFQDLIVCSQSPNKTSIFLGTGTGNFSSTPNFTVASNYSQSIASADFNGDGKTDIATVGLYIISVMLGNGTGNLGAATTYTTGGTSVSIITDDFNGDGKVDLATANDNNTSVSVLLGTGTGSFGFTASFQTTNTLYPYSVISGDFNEDGIKDLLACGNSSPNGMSVSLFKGTGTGNFSPAIGFAANGMQLSTSADFNGDGHLDIAATNYNTDVSVLLGTGTGSFSSPTTFPAGGSPYGITNADFNGDGKIDLAVCNNQANYLSILLGTGTGSFSSAYTFTLNTGATIGAIIKADFNSDSKIDLATSNYTNSSYATIFLNCNAMTSGINQVEKNNDMISIYPNPNNGTFTIETNSLAKQSLQIFDVNGKLVLTQSINAKTNIDASSLNAGVYNVNILNSTGVINKRMVIVR